MSSTATTTTDRKNAAPVKDSMVGGCHSVIIFRITGFVVRPTA